MNRAAIAATSLALCLGLSACAAGTSTSSKAVAGTAEGYPRIVARGVALAPEARPGPATFADRRVRSLTNGRVDMLGLSATERRIFIVRDEGCRSSRLMDWFSPSVAWEGCGESKHWHTARAKVGVRDPLYPLAVGGRGHYQRWATSHSGRTSFRDTRCVVADAVTLDLGAREADAFEVRCDDGRIERTTWFAPGEGPVAYREAHHSRGLRRAWVIAE